MVFVFAVSLHGCTRCVVSCVGCCASVSFAAVVVFLRARVLCCLLQACCLVVVRGFVEVRIVVVCVLFCCNCLRRLVGGAFASARFVCVLAAASVLP
jgi:hypothetical protein